MKNIGEYLLSEKSTILDALKQLEKVSFEKILTLFVISNNKKPVGSITDGDCRRGLINGWNLTDSVCKIMNTKFIFLEDTNYEVKKIRYIRKKKIRFVPMLSEKGLLKNIIDFSENKSYIPVDAVLMAGGKGERLRPMTLTTPKPLLKIAEKSIIDYNIENIQKNGITHINVTVNYLSKQMIEHFKTQSTDIKINCIQEPTYLGTIASINFIKKWHNDTILLMNSDLFTNIDLEDFYLHFLEHGADMSVATVPYTVTIPYGIFDITNTRNIIGLKEKPSYYYYVNAGIYLIKRSCIELIPKDSVVNATDFLQKLIDTKHNVIRYPISGYWIDIGNPEDFSKAQELAKHIKKDH